MKEKQHHTRFFPFLGSSNDEETSDSGSDSSSYFTVSSPQIERRPPLAPATEARLLQACLRLEEFNQVKWPDPGYNKQKKGAKSPHRRKSVKRSKAAAPARAHRRHRSSSVTPKKSPRTAKALHITTSMKPPLPLIIPENINKFSDEKEINVVGPDPLSSWLSDPDSTEVPTLDVRFSQPFGLTTFAWPTNDAAPQTKRRSSNLSHATSVRSTSSGGSRKRRQSQTRSISSPRPRQGSDSKSSSPVHREKKRKSTSKVDLNRPLPPLPSLTTWEEIHEVEGSPVEPSSITNRSPEPPSRNSQRNSRAQLSTISPNIRPSSQQSSKRPDSRTSPRQERPESSTTTLVPSTSKSELQKEPTKKSHSPAPQDKTGNRDSKESTSFYRRPTLPEIVETASVKMQDEQRRSAPALGRLEGVKSAEVQIIELSDDRPTSNPVKRHMDQSLKRAVTAHGNLNPQATSHRNYTRPVHPHQVSKLGRARKVIVRKFSRIFNRGGPAVNISGPICPGNGIGIGVIPAKRRASSQLRLRPQTSSNSKLGAARSDSTAPGHLIHPAYRND